MKIGHANHHPAFAEPLFDPGIPTEVLLRLEREVHPENFVLCARWAKSGPDARVEVRVGFRDQITAGEPIGPDIAELIEMIVATARDKIQVFERSHAGLEKYRSLLGFVADERRLRAKGLRNEWPFLAGIDVVVEKSRGQCQP